MMYPLKMRPEFKEAIWGGENLKKVYQKDIPGNKTAESWEVACHKNGNSIVANGEFKGLTLSEVIEKHGHEIMGTYYCDGVKFPLLFKLLDANDKLSVQVHPDDEFADKNENGELGKTEMWYVLKADEGAKLVFGFNPGVTEKMYKNAINDGTLESLLNYVDVKEGDVFFIKSRTVHAIGGGIMIAEMQQSSDTTYRVYDYNRVGADGKKRELHVEKAVAVSDLDCVTGKEKSTGVKIKAGNNEITYSVSCEYFSMDIMDITDKIEIATEDSVNIVFIADGEGEIEYKGGYESFKTGDTFVIPASLGEYSINGKSKVLNFYSEDNTEKYQMLVQLGFSDEEIENVGGIKKA